MSLVASIAPDDALERLLEDVAIGIRSQERLHPAADQAITLGADGLSIVYILRGSVQLPSGTGLPGRLGSGDALLVSGQRALTIRVPAGSGALVSHLEWAESAAHLADLLPDTAWIHHFDELEPAAAALAHHMGGDHDADHKRGGDLVIC